MMMDASDLNLKLQKLWKDERFLRDFTGMLLNDDDDGTNCMESE